MPTIELHVTSGSHDDKFQWPEFRRSYRSGKSNILAEFLIPALAASSQYERAAGYFTAGSIELLIAGLMPFIKRGGKMFLVISPQLTDNDLESISRGIQSRDSVISNQVNGEIDNLLKENGDVARNLAWLICNRVLDIRFAIPANRKSGIYHEKFGVFTWGPQKVAFTGSLNETAAAFIRNIEYIDVFTSWNDPERIRDKVSDFKDLWEGNAVGVETADFPTALTEKLFTIVQDDFIDLDKQLTTTGEPVSLRPRQRDAIAAWKNNGGRGLLAMATGTGKTITSLFAARELLDEHLRHVVILAPQIALANQWGIECDTILQKKPIICHSQSDWRVMLRNAALISRGDPERRNIIISTYDSSESDDFKASIALLQGDILLIADEVHNVSEELAEVALLERYRLRMGLSATPERWMDDDGNAALLLYFDKIVYRYSLADAIKDETLTPYDYFPVICTRDDAEYLDDNIPNGVDARSSRFKREFTSTPGYIQGHSLVYCSYQTISDILLFLGQDLGLAVHTFTAEESAEERRDILAYFGEGILHSLVAMKCLDEGIDVPATRIAYLLASSTNPKQFIQRRGRVLRRSPGKEKAVIFDFLYLEPATSDRGRASIQRELTRFAEFASVALNADLAVQTLRDAGHAINIDVSEYLMEI